MGFELLPGIGPKAVLPICIVAFIHFQTLEDPSIRFCVNPAHR